MKKFISLSILILGLASCAEHNPSITQSLEHQIAERVAIAHGIENFDQINRVRFDWSVIREGSRVYTRSWEWKPKIDEVSKIDGDSVYSYNWKQLDSLSNEVNKGFINDKFWLFAPFQLVWDRKSFEASFEESIKAPASKEMMNKLTIVYNDQGGYTPGDAYDFYFKDDYIIQEWVYRKSNAPEPSIISICEDYQTLNGLVIAENHWRPDQSARIQLSGLVIE